MQLTADQIRNHLPEGPTSPPEMPEPTSPDELPGIDNHPDEVPPYAPEPEVPEKSPPETPPQT